MAQGQEVVLPYTGAGMSGAGSGVTFAAGAFQGMFAGASFNGSPAENARAFRAEFDRMFEDGVPRGVYMGAV
jgi:hypothetical protein